MTAQAGQEGPARHPALEQEQNTEKEGACLVNIILYVNRE